MKNETTSIQQLLTKALVGRRLLTCKEQDFSLMPEKAPTIKEVTAGLFDEGTFETSYEEYPFMHHEIGYTENIVLLPSRDDLEKRLAAENIAVCHLGNHEGRRPGEWYASRPRRKYRPDSDYDKYEYLNHDGIWRDSCGNGWFQTKEEVEQLLVKLLD